MPLILIIYLLGIIGFFIHLTRLPSYARTKAKLLELLLLYQIVFNVGLTSILAFLGLTFMPDVVSKTLAWPACPFQQELANVNLGFAVLGFLSIWLRKSFWIATVVGFAVWIISDGIHHLYDAYVNQNYSAGNTGLLMYTDFLVPILLAITLFFYIKEPTKAAARVPASRWD